MPKKKEKKEDAMLNQRKEDKTGLGPALLRAILLLMGITILGAGARRIGDVRVEKAQVFFSKSGSSSHTLHYSNIKQDFKVKQLEEMLGEVRAAVRRRATQVTFTQPLHNNTTRSGHFMEDPTMWPAEKVAHRVEYRLSALISRVGRLFQLFRPIKDEITKFGLENPELIADLTFHHRLRHGKRSLVEKHETSQWARIRPEWIYPLRAKRFDPVTIMIAIVAAMVAASVASIFTAVELDRMRAKQQRSETVAKLGLMATSEISNSQEELIRLSAEVIRSLEKTWAGMNTIDHVLLVCDVADKQVHVMESTMQAAMEGHASVAAFTQLDYGTVALKVERDARAVGLEPVARHLSDYLQMETSFIADEDGFSTMVHVPLIDMKSALTIWEHHILPIPVSDGLYVNMGPTELTHLAVTQDHKLYRAMTRAEFNTCRRVGEFYLCDRGLVVTKAPKEDEAPPPWKDPALCLFALYARRFTLAKEVCRKRIGGTDSAMRMVSPNAFGIYAGKAHRGLVTCHGDEPGKLDTKSFTASGLSKITLPNGCSAETDTHIFAAADDGFNRAETDYIVAYVWPFDPLTLTQGLDTKKFSEILRKNLTDLANNTRHNIPLEVALQAVGAEYGIPMNLNQVLDEHQKVTVPMTVVTILVVGLIIAVMAVAIWRGAKERRELYITQQYMIQRQNLLEGKEPNAERLQLQPQAPPPPPERDILFPDPPPYNGRHRGRPPTAAGKEHSLGMNSTLKKTIDNFNRTTTGHSLGMNETELMETGARTRGAFDLGGGQDATRNYPRAPVEISMTDMLSRQ